jgi:hypothetical protein
MGKPMEDSHTEDEDRRIIMNWNLEKHVVVK